MSAFDMWGLDQRLPSVVLRPMEGGPLEAASKAQAARGAGFQFTAHMPSALWAIKEVKARSQLPRTASAIAPSLCASMRVPASRPVHRDTDGHLEEKEYHDMTFVCVMLS